MNVGAKIGAHLSVLTPNPQASGQVQVLMQFKFQESYKPIFKGITHLFSWEDTRNQPHDYLQGIQDIFYAFNLGRKSED